MLSAPLAKAPDVTRYTAELYRPPRRMRPSDAASQYLRNDRGPFESDLSPETIEPLDMLASREYQGIIFVGPARSGKTYTLIHGGITYVVTCAPGDMLVTQMSQDTARDFSRMEVDRVIRHSPELQDRISPRARDDNTFDKYFRSGISLKLGWPSTSQLSSKTLQYVFLTDYDRPENRDDVDGEGPLWGQAFKRIETYMSRGKCLAESSPGEEISRGAWKAKTPHEAPPVRGILELYNAGTRARRYWPCKDCGEYFEAKPGPEAFKLPTFEELEKLVIEQEPMALAKQYARIYCEHCGSMHEIVDRKQMKARGLWVHEGDRIVKDAIDRSGRRESNIVSYWLGGVAASFQSWESMLLGYFQGIAAYARTGDESTLKGVVGRDFAAPYLSRAQAKRRTPEQYAKRLEYWTEGSVPDGVRFLTAFADVQKGKFVVHVEGWGVGLECWIIDRFKIEVSKRESNGRPAGVDPTSYVEDWELLVDELIVKEYPVEGREGITMPIRLALVDSGGQEGVTARAYEFWRGLRKRGLGQRIQLSKGTPLATAPRAIHSWPDSRARSDRHAGSRGDVPVWMLNSNVLKDSVAGDLAREEIGPGYVHLPKWIEQDYFAELTAETKGVKGWERQRGAANEAWDAKYCNRGACIIVGAEKINWDNPPEWAKSLHAHGAPKSGGKDKLSAIEALARQLNG